MFGLFVLYGSGIVITCATAVVALFVGILHLKVFADLAGIWWGKTAASVANAISIMILNNVYGRVAIALNDWENHRTETEYENALILKTFLFQFVNSTLLLFYNFYLQSETRYHVILHISDINYFHFYYKQKQIGYSSLFYMAFFKHRSNIWGQSQACANNSCMPDLRTQLITIFGVQLVVNNTIEVVIPWIKGKVAAGGVEKAGAPVSPGGDSEVELLEKGGGKNYVHGKGHIDFKRELARVKYDGTFREYSEIVIQFGYITLFVVVFPLAPFLALLNNLIEIRVDSSKLINESRRPISESASGIGTWLMILEIMSVIAVICNLSLIFFSGEFLDEYFEMDTATRIISFFVLENIILISKAIVRGLVDDIPGSVLLQVDRSNYLERKIVIGEPDEEDELRQIFDRFDVDKVCICNVLISVVFLQLFGNSLKTNLIFVVLCWCRVEC